MQPNLEKTSKPAEGRSPYRLIRTVALVACRRCGAHCACTEDEVDAGGPA